MHLQVSALHVIVALGAAPALAQQYLDLSAIKYFYTTGASIEWWGAPVQGFPDYANTANGPNHIEYLSYGRDWAVSKWAYPGAVTNASVVNKIVDFNWPNQIAYVKGQFNSDLNNGACGANSLFLMSASNTANDIFQSWNQSAANTPDARKATIGAMINTLGTGLNDLHAMGARNFLFLSVLPVQYTPLIQNLGTDAINSVASYVSDYNSALSNLVKYLAAYYSSDSNIYFSDFTQAFSDVQNGKLSGPTAGYLARSAYCPNVASNYIGATSSQPRNPNYNDCPYGARARQFLFWDDIHVTSPLHCEYAYRTLFSLVGYNAQYPGNCQFASGTD